MTSATIMCGSSVLRSMSSRPWTSGYSPIEVALTTADVPGGSWCGAFQTAVRLRGGLRIDECNELGTPRRVSVDDHHRRNPGESQLDRNGPGRSTGTEDDDALTSGIDNGPQRPDESLTIGVLPDQALVVANDTVDGTNDRR